MAPGDPARDADLASDSHSNVANASTDAGAEIGVEDVLDVRPAIKTFDASSDTYLGGHSTGNVVAAYSTSLTEDATINTASHHKQPRNEILYLQKLLDGNTRIVRTPGVLPMVCYVDASTNVSQDESVDEGLKELKGAMSKLKIKGKLPA
ncbi:hypothetical protein BDZ45DRAFT_801101 [Acephala macrosclerotiorum]|nr:hypothetical protein BDZ45DRAFT_801101 [Acephala macrosclerotiorum]